MLLQVDADRVATLRGVLPTTSGQEYTVPHIVTRVASTIKPRNPLHSDTIEVGICSVSRRCMAPK